MNSINKILKVLGSRVAMNIYFWTFLIVLEYGMNFHTRGRKYYYDPQWYYLFRTITAIMMATLLYLNNLWLLPTFLIKRKYGKYFGLLFLISYAFGLGFAGFFETLDIYFPKIEVPDVSLFSTGRVIYPTRWIIFLEGLAWLLPIFVGVFMFSVAWYMQDYKRQRRVLEETQKKQLEAELNFLKSQINPHFLFNTLNNLYALTVKKSDNAPDVVSKLSTILRYLLYESDSKAVPFEKEKEIMEAYIELELLRLSNKQNLNFSISADRSYNIPPLLWVSILENIFKHGTRYISSEYYIDYNFSIRDNNLSIVSKNSFKGPDAKNNLETTGGIGLSNLQKRLTLLYPGKHEVAAHEEGNYFITNVQIQLN